MIYHTHIGIIVIAILSFSVSQRSTFIAGRFCSFMLDDIRLDFMDPTMGKYTCDGSLHLVQKIVKIYKERTCSTVHI